MLAQGGLGSHGVDIGVAVAVAADPTAEAQEVRHLEGMAREGLSQCPAQAFLDLGRQVEERCLEVVEPVSHLVQDAGPVSAGLLGLPQRREFFTEALECGGALVGGRGFEVEPMQQTGQAVKLGEHGTTLGLGRMCGEHRHDQQPVQNALHLLGR